MSSHYLTATAAPEHRLTLLLVDDDQTFRHALAENLRDDGHVVLEYAAPGEVPALATLGNVDAVLTDYEMPGTSGLCFADHVHATCPQVPIVVLTTHWEAGLVIDAASRPFVSLLHKPIDYNQLHRLLRRLVSDAAPSS